MADEESVQALIKSVRNKIANEGLPTKQLAKKADVKYNTVKSFLDGTRMPHFDTFIRIMLAAGLTLSEFGYSDGRMVEVNEEELSYVRRYKRLNEEYQKHIKISIDGCTSLQEKILEGEAPEDEGVKKPDRRKKKS